MNRISLPALRSRSDRRDRNRMKFLGSVEPLEGRALLALFTWNSVADGNFNDPSMWNGPNGIHAVPGPGDDANAPVGSGKITVTGSATVNSFVGASALVVASGTFSVTGASSGTNSTITNLSVAAGASFHTGRTTTITGSGLISGNLDAGAGGRSSWTAARTRSTSRPARL
jgi:hypothetical protein